MIVRRKLINFSAKIWRPYARRVFVLLAVLLLCKILRVSERPASLSDELRSRPNGLDDKNERDSEKHGKLKRYGTKFAAKKLEVNNVGGLKNLDKGFNPVADKRFVPDIQYLKPFDDIREKRRSRFHRREEKKYLFPIFLGNQGPNNQLQSFKMSAVISAYRNRALVLTPFFNHFTVDTEDLRLSNETVDIDAVRKLLPVATIEEFSEACGGRVDVLFHGVNMTNNMAWEDYYSTLTYVNDMLRIFTKVTGISLPDMQKEPGRLVHLPDDIPDGYTPFRKVASMPGLFQSKRKCVGLAYPYGLLGRFYYYDYVSVFAKTVLRPKYIRDLAEQIIQETLKNFRYLGIHWRYNDEWRKNWCLMKCERCRKACSGLNATGSDVLVNVIDKLMTRNSLRGVYIATPLPPEDPFLLDLRRQLPTILTSTDILMSGIKDVGVLKNDNYKISMLEQELCKRSTFFLGSSLSSWTDIVLEDRERKDTALIPNIFEDD
ncbi:uncharacterized protein [Ptychodera flava]|uniref:uncharacterized protein n=1 Tax=Ptychodera flava TaxID=63121 RepID=UPI00396A0A2D